MTPSYSCSTPALWPVVSVAPPKLDLAGVCHPLRRGALVRLEFCVVSAGDDLVLQSVRLAVAVRIRRMVWRRRRSQAGIPDQVTPGAGVVGCLDSFCALDRDDLARRVPRSDGAEMDDQGDLSDR